MTAGRTGRRLKRVRFGNSDVEVRAGDLVRALEAARDATGDPLFEDALAAVRAYGLDREIGRGLEAANDAIYGDQDEVHFVMMDWLLEQGHERSAHAAAKQVVTPKVDDPRRRPDVKVHGGGSDDAKVKRLRTGYRVWKDRQQQQRSRADGALPFWIEVTPLATVVRDEDGNRLVGPASCRATRWWRRRWRDGDVSVARLKAGV